MLAARLSDSSEPNLDLNNRVDLLRDLLSSRPESSAETDIEVYFSGIKKTLLEWISHQKVVWGCQLTLSDSDVLDALSKVPVVFIICSDSFARVEASWLQERYWRINSSLGSTGYFDPGIYVCSPPGLDSASFRRTLMHHKFFIGSEIASPCRAISHFAETPLARLDELWIKGDETLSVFTGSYNASYASRNNLETAMIIQGRGSAIRSFACEFESLLLWGPPEVNFFYPKSIDQDEVRYITHMRWWSLKAALKAQIEALSFDSINELPEYGARWMMAYSHRISMWPEDLPPRPIDPQII